MVPDPVGQFRFGHASIGERPYFSNDFGIGRIELVAVHLKKRYHRQKSNAFVAIAVWVVLDKAKAVRGRQRRHVGALGVMPFLLGARQSRFEHVVVANARQPSVFAKLVVVQGIDDQAAQPQRFA